MDIYQAIAKLKAGKEDWKPSMPSRGLGDTVAKVTHATGVAQVVERVAKAIGRDCGCKKRQAKLNALVPYQETGLLSPACQSRIQIEITNACPNRCSNCTRLCSHVKEPFFMDIETFRRCVDSMDGYTGMLGVMGGEPTLHPQFAEMAQYLAEHWHPNQSATQGRELMGDFASYYAERLKDLSHPRGLWSCVGSGYYEHHELIMDTFGYQCLNDHSGEVNHQAFLITRKELGIPDKAWKKLRDKCWVQRLWSSSMNHLGAYPCEIMAAMAAAGYDGPKGWLIEPGWWRRESKDFGDMLDWCELCAFPLNTPTRDSRDGIQDISLGHLDRLVAISSPAIKAGRFEVIDLESIRKTASKGSESTDPERYLPNERKSRRVSQDNPNIHPKRIDALTVCVDFGDSLARTLPANIKHFDRYIVVTASHDTKTQAIVQQCGAELVVSDECYANQDAFNKGRMLNAGLDVLKPSDWLLFIDADIFLSPDYGEQLRNSTLNPGCLYFTRRFQLPRDRETPDWDNRATWKLGAVDEDYSPWGYHQLVNVRASALKDGLRLPTCFCSAGGPDHWFCLQWHDSKRISLPPGTFDTVHIPHGRLTTNWNGARAKATDWRFAAHTHIIDTQTISRHLIPPLWLRKVCVKTLEQETVRWEGGTVPWVNEDLANGPWLVEYRRD